MRQGKQNYQRKKAGMVQFYFGEPCRTFHPECAQCQAWALTPAKRWEETKAGVEEWREAAKELSAACQQAELQEGLMLRAYNDFMEKQHGDAG